MKADVEKGEYVIHDLCREVNRKPGEGGHHSAMSGSFAVLQRHMDQKEVTPVDVFIGDLVHSEEKSYVPGDDTLYPTRSREIQVVFRPGKSEQLFAEWFCGRSLVKKPATI